MTAKSRSSNKLIEFTIEQYIILRMRGYNQSMIADELNVTKGAIHYWRERHGIPNDDRYLIEYYIKRKGIVLS